MRVQGLGSVLSLVRHLCVGGAFACSTACGQAGTIVPTYAQSPQAGGPTTVDGAPEGSHNPMPQILNAGGLVMAEPVLRTISFNNDPAAAIWEAFIAALPASHYWEATTQEYGVGHATAGPPLRSNLTVSAGLTDGVAQRGEASDIEAFLISQLDGTSPPWGVPSTQTLYVLFLPTGAIVSDSAAEAQTVCADGAIAWHTAMLLPASQVIITYAVIPDCGAIGTLSKQDSRTLAASHAIIEAVTDPHLDAFTTFDPNHLHWSVAAEGTEVGAACVAAMYGDPNLLLQPSADLHFLVQRTWSNAAAAAGHDPCVPAPLPAVNPFFTSVPRTTQSVMAPLGTNLLNPMVTTAGMQVAPGATATLPIDLFSDGAMSGPWQVVATEVNTHNTTLALNAAQGNNGTSLNLTVQAQANATGDSLVRITSILGTRQHSQYLLVTY